MDQHQVSFSEVNIEEDEEGAKRVMEHNAGNRAVPTFEIDGAWYTNPDPATLEKLVGAA